MKIEKVLARFLANVERLDGCWKWTGKKDKDGYGIFNCRLFGKRHTRAPRAAWMLQNRVLIPSGAHVRHSCDNPECVRIDHLLLGKPIDNTQDMIVRGRQRPARGEETGHAVLTEEQAKAILSDTRPYAAIGEDYGIAASTVGSIKNGVSWKHLKGERKRSARVSPRRGVSDNITPEIVRAIRASTETYSTLAAKYGVTVQTICDIRKRRSWKHVS